MPELRMLHQNTAGISRWIKIAVNRIRLRQRNGMSCNLCQ